ncbi:MAG: two-component system sensor histidine kinase CreC [Sulfuritalea sp.]|nr:two-component system sensor histidine kinase CreC [Sulfuritalea sp.]MDP1981712.1 two-component system sensor histidine kinase CreC [Sulfuritalea sp.]
MSRRNRIFLGILGLFALLVTLLLYRVATDLDPRYRESAEESLVDTAHLLAAFIETDMREHRIDPTRLRAALDAVYARRFEARIFDIVKRQVDLRVYLTDANGTVLFDSTGESIGQDFRGWRDVGRALLGEYGARTTLSDPDNPRTAVMFVAAPIYDTGRIVGVVSVGKPVESQHKLVVTARQKLLYVGLITLVGFVLLLVVLLVWLARPFGLTTDVLRVMRQEGFRHPARLLRRLRTVSTAAFDDMRDALAGRSYTEEYVQTLTHELKSPLTAIRGAAELLREPMPDAQRLRFTANINEQVQRLQVLADRLLELAGLEKRHTLDDIQPVDVDSVVRDAIAAMEPAAQRKDVTLQLHSAASLRVEGDAFLLQQALVNLLANAIDFSPQGALIEMTASKTGRCVELSVLDHGPGVPDYALDRVFEKFYSLRRPDSGKKGTGLGLAFVREIAQLHGGKAYLANQPDGGAIAVLILPAMP